jgi:hypothetical protein
MPRCDASTGVFGGSLSAVSLGAFGRDILQPILHLIDFALNEVFILEGIEKGRGALTLGEKVHRKRIRIGFSAECDELTAEPRPEQHEQSAGVCPRRMVKLRKLAR